MLQVNPIATPIFSPGDDLISFIVGQIKSGVQEGQVLAVTSKIVSLAEGRLISQSEIEKEDLVRQAEFFRIVDQRT